MLIVPLHQPPTRANFPWVTLLLVLINCVVYFGFQLDDENKAKAAASYYQQSILGELELDAWLEQLDQAKRSELQVQWGAYIDNQQTRVPLLLPMLQSDPNFLARLNNNQVIKPDHAQYAAWKSAREYFNALWQQQFTERFMARYTSLDLTRILTSTFLHGDASHLLGNMIFLAVLGLLVEGALGGSLYLSLYLLAGIGAGLASLAFRFGDPGGGLGASGAIAGLMGAYSVLYGLRRVRVFYWFFVVMDYVRVPALVLLPVWLAWEVLSLALNDGSNVAFDAHAGGLVTGALLGALILRLRWQRVDFIEGSSEANTPQKQLALALDHLGKTELGKAASILSPLAENHPNDYAIQRALYRLRRMMSPHAPPHELAHRLLLEFGYKKADAHELEMVFEDYLKAAKGKPKLSGTELNTLASKMLALDRVAAAERIARVLTAQSSTQEAGLNILLKIAQRRLERQDQPAAIALLREITQRAAKDSPLLARARALIRGPSG